MFGKQEEAGGEPRSQSLIQEGVTVRGDISAKGDIRLEGDIEGTVSTKARIIIGATGKVKADLEAAEVLIMGHLTGKVRGLKRVELRKGAHVEGDLTTPALVIEEGVFFQGQSQMQTSAKALPPSPTSAHGQSDSLEPGRPQRPDLLSTTSDKPSR
jgi:cytoskeletal protein CcmA (bactofilin family)